MSKYSLKALLTEKQIKHTMRYVKKTSSCWIWTGNIKKDGYGQKMLNGKTFKAHRVVWECVNGPIPKGLQLDHLCRVRHCVNPSHLEPVTQKENILRGISPSAIHAKKTHCINGHEFTAENTYRFKNRRQCKACRKITDSNRLGQRRAYHRARYRKFQELKND
jgi:hypothetical protein